MHTHDGASMPAAVYFHSSSASNTTIGTALLQGLSSAAVAQGLTPTNSSQPLPPGSAGSFTAARPSLPAIVITDHDSVYVNR